LEQAEHQERTESVVRVQHKAVTHRLQLSSLPLAVVAVVLPTATMQHRVVPAVVAVKTDSLVKREPPDKVMLVVRHKVALLTLEAVAVVLVKSAVLALRAKLLAMVVTV
jgi:hypothetical protein